MRDSISGSGISTSRLDELLNSINQARNSLTHWQDKRTEALISLDAFTYDIKMIEEERKGFSIELQDVKSDLNAQIRIYQSHVNELTDQLQLLKLENEGSRNEILSKDLLIENHLREIINQEKIREQLQNQHASREADIQNEVETRAAQKIWDLEMKNEALNLKLQEVAEKRNEIKLRAERLELELVQLRGQMMNALKVSPMSEESFAEVGIKATPVVATVNASEAPAGAESGQKTAKAASSKMTMEEVRKLRPIEAEGDTVEDYLKRLGY